MNPILKNILAVAVGLVVGAVVNMGFIMMSGYVIPPPEGADLTTEEGLKASMHLMQPKHFIFPFLAHAIGTLVGAFLAAKLSANSPMRLALVVGAFFLAGGLMMVFQLPSPTWFNILDIGAAYFPMAYLGGKWGMPKAQ